ncbi:response regulator [Legionella nagasakiensis]|uniref:response regulator n=1 Tax=Legionella nagasakiensis TaxID=535290 RepID=UPI00105412C1|nr:response regulator [Legionella nagasakiensis]
MRVLIVEDDKTNQMLASLFFKKAGIASGDIVIVNDGQEAIELITENAANRG